MMTMCPTCFELYSEIWSKPCCDCKSKTIAVSVELINVTQLFINRGFKIISANCSTHDDQDDRGKVTQIQIDFGLNYPDILFNGLPPDWLLSGYKLVKDSHRLEPELPLLSCVCIHPSSECDDTSIQFEKLLTISNLEVWLEAKDPEAYKAILILTGCQ